MSGEWGTAEAAGQRSIDKGNITMYDGPIVDSHHLLWEWKNYPRLVAPITPKMYGSNFPLEKLWASYDDLVATTKRILEGRSPGDQLDYFHDTATAFYRI